MISLPEVTETQQKRADNLIWNAAGSYGFRPDFKAYDSIGLADIYWNPIIGASRKYYDYPQFEKLCMLRNRIMKNPELQWNISEIAESMFLSKSYLQKIYKTYFNRSIIEEMIRFRLDMAKKLLDETELTVTEISKKCGYSSYNYFVRQFRMSEGVSPSEYRENNLRNTI